MQSAVTRRRRFSPHYSHEILFAYTFRIADGMNLFNFTTFGVSCNLWKGMSCVIHQKRPNAPPMLSLTVQSAWTQKATAVPTSRQYFPSCGTARLTGHTNFNTSVARTHLCVSLLCCECVGDISQHGWYLIPSRHAWDTVVNLVRCQENSLTKSFVLFYSISLLVFAKFLLLLLSMLCFHRARCS